MGLDISLLKIEKTETQRFGWLEADDSPELDGKFPEFRVNRLFHDPEGDYYEDVYYYSEISHQRKGVSREFYESIKNCKCIVDKEELERMLPFVREERLENFRREFIDKFVEGETCVLVSW